MVTVSLAARSSRVPLPLRRLQILCVSWQLSRSSGLPPLETGMISSTSARMGCGTQPGQSGRTHRGLCCPGMVLRVLSTGSPHRAQWSDWALTSRLMRRRAVPLVVRGSGLVTRFYLFGVCGVAEYAG